MNVPNAVSQIHHALSWFQPSNGTPDYFNACDTPWTFNNVHVPDNLLGYQYAQNGNAYAGIMVFQYSPDSRYVESKLDSPLIASYYYVQDIMYRVLMAAFWQTDE